MNLVNQLSTQLASLGVINAYVVMFMVGMLALVLSAALIELIGVVVERNQRRLQRDVLECVEDSVVGGD